MAGPKRKRSAADSGGPDQPRPKRVQQHLPAVPTDFPGAIILNEGNRKNSPKAIKEAQQAPLVQWSEKERVLASYGDSSFDHVSGHGGFSVVFRRRPEDGGNPEIVQQGWYVADMEDNNLGEAYALAQSIATIRDEILSWKPLSSADHMHRQDISATTSASPSLSLTPHRFNNGCPTRIKAKVFTDSRKILLVLKGSIRSIFSPRTRKGKTEREIYDLIVAEARELLALSTTHPDLVSEVFLEAIWCPSHQSGKNIIDLHQRAGQGANKARKGRQDFCTIITGRKQKQTRDVAPLSSIARKMKTAASKAATALKSMGNASIKRVQNLVIRRAEDGKEEGRGQI
ncbi:hypothetical protein QBC43DRAFT_359388 [Cladorrhinum sp. PSN259]|nr:hypothetical protein QBC43DRAFT_359388 [Cladorrhinum sp. PSN259]